MVNLGDKNLSVMILSLAVRYNVFFFSKFLVPETGHKFSLSPCLLCLLVSPPNIWYIFLFSQDPHISPWPVFFETQWIWEQLETLTNVADFWTHRLIRDGSSICLFCTKAIHIFCAIFSLEPLQTYQQSACLSGCKVVAWAPPLAPQVLLLIEDSGLWPLFVVYREFESWPGWEVKTVFVKLTKVTFTQAPWACVKFAHI